MFSADRPLSFLANGVQMEREQLPSDGSAFTGCAVHQVELADILRKTN